MNLFINILFLALTVFFLGVYIFNLILNLIRATKTNKRIKSDPQKLEAKVVDIKQIKKRVYIEVSYVSKANLETFTDFYEITQAEFKDQYYVGQKLDLVYPSVKGLKRVTCFPTYLEGMKFKIQSGPLFTDILYVVFGIFIVSFTLYNMLIHNAFSGDVPLFSMDGTAGVMSPFIIIIYLVIYLILMSYIIERLVGMTKDHNEKYLKICGLRAKAEVMTYKLTKTKNAQGVKQSQIKVSFRSNVGEKIETDISSFMYTEKPDQFIDVLYDGVKPKRAVYLKK